MDREERLLPWRTGPIPTLPCTKPGGEAESVYLLMRDLDARCEALMKGCGNETMVIISADHGHIDVNRYVDISDLPGFVDCLIMPPFLESRSALFFVKHERHREFEEIFQSHLSKEFALFSRKEILSRGLFGAVSEATPAHQKTDDFIGDYLITATGKRALKYYESEHDHSHDFASHHAGMTESENEDSTDRVASANVKKVRQNKKALPECRKGF